MWRDLANLAPEKKNSSAPPGQITLFSAVFPLLLEICGVGCLSQGEGGAKREEIKVKRVNKKGNLVVNGYCDSLGILPLVLVGAGLAIGGGSSGSGSTSSNLIN